MDINLSTDILSVIGVLLAAGAATYVFIKVLTTE